MDASSPVESTILGRMRAVRASLSEALASFVAGVAIFLYSIFGGESVG